MADKRDTYDDNGSGFSKEFVIWITLLVSIILILCVFDLCGPLSGIFGAFLFGMFGFMALQKLSKFPAHIPVPAFLLCRFLFDE